MRLVGYLPGLCAALVAFVVLKLSSVALSTWWEFLVYLTTYAIVSVVVDVMLRRYGR